MQTIAVYDIETPFITNAGIDAITKIYCIAVTMILDGEPQPAKLFTEYYTSYSDGSLTQAINLINTADIRCAHNGLGFDDIVIRHVIGVTLIPTPYDTLILSKLMYSADELISIDASLGLPKDIWGSFSLKAFGKRLGNDKIEFQEFNTGLTKEMATYCKQDTDLTADLLLFLQSKSFFPLPEVITLEHEAAIIIAEQTSFGFYFDITKARILNTELLQEKQDIALELARSFHPKFLPNGPVKEYVKKSTIKQYIPNTTYIAPW